MFKLRFAKSFVKDFKRLPQEVQQHIMEKWFPRLEQDPKQGMRFSGKDLRKFWRIKFRFKRNDYRIVYTLHKKELLVVLLAVGSRENFYKKYTRKRS